jgi:hypothetical protein
VKPDSLKRLRILVGLLIVTEVLCFGVAVSGNQPISMRIRERLHELTKNPTPENKALLDEEMARADEPYRRIRTGAWVGLGLNSLGLLAAIRVLKKEQSSD